MRSFVFSCFHSSSSPSLVVPFSYLALFPSLSSSPSPQDLPSTTEEEHHPQWLQPHLTMMWEEVTCSICLDPMVEPMSIECGHSFCQGSASLRSGKKEVACPVCRRHFLLQNLRPNRQVANMVDNLRKISQGAKGRAHTGAVCGAQRECKFTSSVRQMGRLPCWVCSQSQKHRDHPMVPIGGGCSEYQVSPQHRGRLQKGDGALLMALFLRAGNGRELPVGLGKE